MSAASPLSKPLLAVPAAGYHAVQKLREIGYSLGLLKTESTEAPVISVGNILLGGSGKTPFVMFVAHMLYELGLKPGIVSRGYRGQYRGEYLVVSEGASSIRGALVGPDMCGDEPFLMAQRLPHVPVIVGRKRIHPVRAAQEKLGCTVIVLDDGFQHLPLQRNADVVLLNGTEDAMFPLGRLREPFSALRRATMIVLVGEGTEVPASAAPHVGNVPVFRCRHNPIGVHRGFSDPLHAVDLFSGKDVLLASAIANPSRFRDTAESLAWRVVGHRVFQDHHRITADELDDLLIEAGDAPVVVTEKDWVKLPERGTRTGRIWTLRIHTVVEDEATFRDTIRRLIEQR